MTALKPVARGDTASLFVDDEDDEDDEGVGLRVTTPPPPVDLAAVVVFLVGVHRGEAVR